MFFVNIMYALHLPTERFHPLYPTCQHSTIHQNYCWPPFKNVARMGIVLNKLSSQKNLAVLMVSRQILANI